MFLELLNNDVFTAKNLVTPWNQTKKIQLGSRVSRTLLKETSGMDVDNIPVCEGNSVLGYAKRGRLRAGEIVTRRHLYRSTSRCTVDPSSQLPDLVAKIRSDGLQDYKLYVVQSPSKTPQGVMTYADLNRRTVYINCYVLLNFLEQWVKGRIMAKYGELNRTLNHLWMSTLGVQRAEELLKEAQERGQTPLGVADLGDLIRVLKEDLEPDMSNDRRRMVDAALPLRTKVAHPVKLLLPKSDLDSLSHLFHLRRGMMPVVRENDFNEKNGGWPVHPPN